MKKDSELVYPELSYKIVGFLFEVYNTIGPGHKEKVYEEAVSSLLTENGIKHNRQVYFPVKFRNKVIGKYYLDLLIEDKIVLELKKGNRVSKRNIDQILSYLKAKNLKLGIIAQFGTDEVKFKRILNIRG